MWSESAKELPFLYLALDLPPAPLYRDEQMQNIIPQVPLTALLQKFNGTTEKHMPSEGPSDARLQ
ncbi:hypothetical protein ANCCEY_06156 [Ancylostoma ceylanicum]|uniref:Uncharacterized protein n=1 Tax=Ancylostoma ceylanicum TaxID=53326 RepID=A0A0D6LX99_9BILA|nr:hypothetical protein ANCCEY_06156 [Ancylostoma ceylanicum]